VAHRHPKRGDVKTTDDRLLETAVLSCGDWLMTDLRIEVAYQGWMRVHDLDRLLRRVRIWGTGGEDAERFRLAVWAGPLDGEVDALWTSLQEMGVPWPWVSPWLLTNSFPIHYASTFTPGARPEKFVPQTEMGPTATKGRQPTAHALESLHRHVGWWYRTKIKHPPATNLDIEQEELARSGEISASKRHSTVIQGIKRAERLLSLWDRYEIDLVTPFGRHRLP
jgi:hypothetical protein